MLMTMPQTGRQPLSVSMLHDYAQEEALVTDFAKMSPTYARLVLKDRDTIPDGCNLGRYFEKQRKALQDTLHTISGSAAPSATRWYSKIGVTVAENLQGNFIGAAGGTYTSSICPVVGSLVSLCIFCSVMGQKDRQPGFATPMAISSVLIPFVLMLPTLIPGASPDFFSNNLWAYLVACGASGLLGFLSGVGVSAAGQILDNRSQIKAENKIHERVLAAQAALEAITAQENQLVASAYVLQRVASDLELTRSFFDEGVRTCFTRLKGEAEVNLGTAKSTHERLQARIRDREQELDRPDTDKSTVLLLIAKLRTTLAGQAETISRIVSI